MTIPSFQLTRKIIHIDMDCFYAAIEERDRPEYRGKPLAVGGAANQRGVLCTCNYPARQRGLHSAMPTRRALALCPELILLPVDMNKYRQVSQAIHHIFRDFTPLIEPLSLDEAYLDVTACTTLSGSATRIAMEIKRQIKEQLALTASAGVAPNKFLAKVASDWRKPDGLWVITPAEISDFVAALPVDKLSGVGQVTAHKLRKKGILTCRDLQRYDLTQLRDDWGKLGERFYALCRGIDDRPVEPNRIRRSLSVEQTFPEDLRNLSAAQKVLPDLFQLLQNRLSRYNSRTIKGQFIKIKFHDFTQTTAECIHSPPELALFHELLAEGFRRGNKNIRLIGLGVRFHENDPDISNKNNWQQLSLSFD
jgi:DNA polymerase-4